MKLGTNQRLNWKFTTQFIAILLSAFTLKLYYSTASVNHLRWILAPTTVIVELVTGWQFEFESHAGYITSDRTFVIAASCAGVNFLLTAFLMLSLRKLWQNRSHNLAWRFIPAAALFAYLATLVANTVRISTALLLQGKSLEAGWLSQNQLHRLEGIVIYFGFLLLLFLVSERMSYRNSGSNRGMLSVSSKGPLDLFRRSLFPLLVYYAIALGIPMAKGAQGTDFWEHSFFVLITPLLLLLPLAAFRFYRYQRADSGARSVVRSRRDVMSIDSHNRKCVPLQRSGM